MRISDWSSDVCSSDLGPRGDRLVDDPSTTIGALMPPMAARRRCVYIVTGCCRSPARACARTSNRQPWWPDEQLHRPSFVFTRSDGRRRLVAGRRFWPVSGQGGELGPRSRSEEHTSEIQSLMRHSYAV